MKPIQLEQYFTGEESWQTFITAFDPDWMATSQQKSLLKKLGNRLDLAKVIHHHFGEAGLAWTDRKVPALDNLTPIECLSQENTITRLKECLMRIY